MRGKRHARSAWSELICARPRRCRRGVHSARRRRGAASLGFDAAETARGRKCADLCRDESNYLRAFVAECCLRPVVYPGWVSPSRKLILVAVTARARGLAPPHVAAAAAALHAVDDAEPPRYRAARRAAVAAHTAARRRLLRRAHAGRRAARPLLGGAARLLALRAHEHVEHSRPEACTSPCTLASASAGSGRPPSLGQPRTA